MRKTLTTIHVVLAAFFLPMGLLYAITGGLYTWQITGRTATTEHRIALAAPLPAELSGQAALVEAELARRALAVPSGAARMRKGGTSQYFEWTGLRRDVQLHPTTDAAVALLKIVDAGPHRFFVQLHKAKGGQPFKVLSALWAIGLVALLLTGGTIAWISRPYRRLAIIAALLGLLSFASLAALS